MLTDAIINDFLSENPMKAASLKPYADKAK